MNLDFRKHIIDYILHHEKYKDVIENIVYNSDGTGKITYNTLNIFVDPSAMNFNGATTNIGDEELVRAYLILNLVSKYKYPLGATVIEIERTYKSVGRPGKGGRIDIIVRTQDVNKQGDAFLFIECKAPEKFDEDFKLIDGQLFRLSKQEKVRPRNLVYFTVEKKLDILRERIILVDTTTFSEYEDWDDAGQPIVDSIPLNYGIAKKKKYAKVQIESANAKPLDKATTPQTFNRIRNEINQVIWGGGGTNNNEVFVYITKLILCKIFDEQETIPEKEYGFQRLGDALTPESSESLVKRMNALYKSAEESYLALPKASAGPAFDTARIAPEKIAYVVGRLEGISITQNIHEGDLLGEFFEKIVAQDFTQSKGQFFTPPKIVRFMLSLMGVVDKARNIMLTQKDHLGRYRLPYVIDPSCGSGTILIEYMKLIRDSLAPIEIKKNLPDRLVAMHDAWFSGPSQNNWARDYLFGIENNYDLGLGAKVNMVLHGDGSMNTWIRSGLLPFNKYWIDGRHNFLGTSKNIDADHVYKNAINEQFDFVISNPPFSITMSPDEKKEVQDAFSGYLSLSESLFIERWYQLLREDGHFCCVLPEAILDTSTNKSARMFILKHFELLAVVSLPYDTFKPFTSTKTCIVYARKRKKEEIKEFEKKYNDLKTSKRSFTEEELLRQIVEELRWDEKKIFFAEPQKVGYKRRKNLPDILDRNDLYEEDMNSNQIFMDGESVLSSFLRKDYEKCSLTFGFYSNLSNVFSRKNFRLDPKYRWLWDYEKGKVLGESEDLKPLGEYLSIVKLEKKVKGELEADFPLIDLEYVETRQAIVSEFVPVVDQIGSDKVIFEKIDLAFSKLEPYLGKVIINPPSGSLGSSEWVGFKIEKNVPTEIMAYLLMHPKMCEAYRKLQSGKRHARLDPSEMLELKISLSDNLIELNKDVITKRSQIFELRKEEKLLRDQIDKFLSKEID